MTENVEEQELIFRCDPEILAGIDDYAFAYDLESRAAAIAVLLRRGISVEKRREPERKGDRVKMAVRVSQAMGRKIRIAAAVNDRMTNDEIVVRLEEASGKAVATVRGEYNEDRPYIGFSVPIELYFEMERDAKAAGRSLVSEVISRLAWTLRGARAG